MSFWEITFYLAQGFGVTLLLFVLTLLFALPLGLVFAFGAMTKFKPLRWLTRGFVYIIRGTPLLLQLMIVVYLPGLAFNYPLPKWGIFGGNTDAAYFFGALVGFVINYACYFSEIYRGGIENIPRGQYEAGQVLGMTRSQVFFKVILKQVFKNVLAPISNEVVTLVKDTALARSISVLEIFFCAEQVLSREMIIWPLFYTGAFYLIFNSLLTFLFGKMEKRMARYR
ncbi:MAG: amino acid ABC transporter permease [Clostridia bacterium]|nr:amino acid ABC transporter permease [Clostridia bacterium]